MLRLATMQDLTRIMAIVQATVREMHAYRQLPVGRGLSN